MSSNLGNESVFPLLNKFYSSEAIAKEGWSPKATLYLPKGRLILIENAGAESLASLIYLQTLNLQFKLEFRKNVNEMSPSGRGPLLNCGRFSIGEFEPIVKFCTLKGFRLFSEDPENPISGIIKSYLLMIKKNFSTIIVIRQIYNDFYPLPLGYVLFYKELYFNKNRLGKLWSMKEDEVLKSFLEINESLNRKLERQNFLINNRMTEVDVLLYSYLRIIRKNKQFETAKNTLQDLHNLNRYYENMNARFEHFIQEKLKHETHF